MLSVVARSFQVPDDRVLESSAHAPEPDETEGSA